MHKSLSKLLHDDFVKLASEIEARAIIDGTTKRGTGKLFPQFVESVSFYMMEGLRAYLAHPNHTASTSLNSNHYTSSYRYNIRSFSYRIHVERAWQQLLASAYLQIDRRGFRNASKGFSGKTLYRLTDKGLDWFRLLGEKHFQLPALDEWVVLPDLIPERELVVVQRKNDDNQKIKLPYEDTEFTRSLRTDLEIINRLYLQHWIDLELNKDGWHSLHLATLKKHKRKRSIPAYLDLSQRTLYSVFNDKEFTRGGRLYGGWWQTIPSEFRQHIVIDGKPTVEYDFSGLHPTLLYLEEDEQPLDDPYSPILGDNHRKLAKQLFNAIVNATEEMKGPPRHTRISHTGKTWRQIRERILEVHAPIRHRFETGYGNYLMRKDSELALAVVRHFAELGIVCLPVHDSFIMHHGYKSELREVMNTAFKRLVKGEATLSEKGVESEELLLDVWEFTPDKFMDAVSSEEHGLLSPQFRRQAAFHEMTGDLSRL